MEKLVKVFVQSFTSERKMSENFSYLKFVGLTYFSDADCPLQDASSFLRLLITLDLQKEKKNISSSSSNTSRDEVEDNKQDLRDSKLRDELNTHLSSAS